jgi:hypothetical protein
MTRHRDWPVRQVLRRYGAVLPLAAAVIAIVVAVSAATRGGNEWCDGNSFSCSLNSNLLGVVAIGGATTYWYFGLRRTVLLTRYRRRLRARVASAAAGDLGRDDGPQGEVASRVAASYGDWSQLPRLTLLTGASGSGKTEVFSTAVVRLARRGNWVVPVPLGAMGAGTPEDLLASARQQLDLVLLDVNANEDLIDWLWRSLLRCNRALLVIDDVEAIAPGSSTSDRELVVRRMFSSASHLGLPLLATGKPDLIDSPPGSVLELPRLADRALEQRLRDALDLDPGQLATLTAAVSGPLATPFMIERIIWLLRRSGDTVVSTVDGADPQVRDLALWDLLLAEHAVAGASLGRDGLRLLAFSLIRTGRREVVVPDSEDWREAVELGRAVGTDVRWSGPSAAEVRSFVEGGFLDRGSSRLVLRFASFEVQAVLAGGFLAAQPDRVVELANQLGTSGTARQVVAQALRLDRRRGEVHEALLTALDTDLPPAAEAAVLSLALRHPPPTLNEEMEADLAHRLALTLADRVTASGGPVLAVAGMRDAIGALDRHVSHDAERHLLQAMLSSSFQVRLSAAIALLRRDAPRRCSTRWTAGSAPQSRLRPPACSTSSASLSGSARTCASATATAAAPSCTSAGSGWLSPLPATL